MATTSAACLSADGIPDALGILAALLSLGGEGGEIERTSPARQKQRRDAALVEGARRGDQDSFRLLVELHGRAVYALALRIVQSAQDAEEVAQDTFLRAWRALPEFRGESSFSTWLYRIATRRAIARVAVTGRRAKSEVAFDGRDVDEMPDPATARPMDAARLRLERLIAALPETQRAVITLFYLQDCSVHEVATALDLPAGTVKTHLHRSRAALRTAWLRETGREGSDELRRP
jgi:RNA polymerase sigma-70 factor, ECF subfamily